jgi:hypothetical protein
MSRSRKKPIIKDSIHRSTKLARRAAHKMMRQRARARIDNEQFDMMPEDEAEFFSDWDICDNRYDLRWERPGGDRDEWVAKAARK